MARGLGTNFLIGWVILVATGIAGDNIFDSFQIIEHRFDAPKTSGRECCCFKFWHRRSVTNQVRVTPLGGSALRPRTARVSRVNAQLLLERSLLVLSQLLDHRHIL